MIKVNYPHIYTLFLYVNTEGHSTKFILCLPLQNCSRWMEICNILCVTVTEQPSPFSVIGFTTQLINVSCCLIESLAAAQLHTVCEISATSSISQKGKWGQRWQVADPKSLSMPASSACSGTW